ncbi:MAG: SUMF1/EgtB/PvdO family nonheme iron enzyme, partial [Candidatus Marinimicrobia bacterium]|nr:SUMF1/EgtB/PvdO family nonheme iron enzyme [Candidatus Neomarinimicrobiota bacterium]
MNKQFPSSFLFILLFMTLGSRFLPAQTISNVHVRQEGLEIIITYDMAGQLQSGDEIKVGYSTDGGRNYKPISGADGDVGKNVKTGTGREISFFANDALAGKNASFKVVVFSLPPGMVFVAGGTFQMGSNSESDEKPIHTVTVSSFFMDKTEVTQAEYRKVMGKTPSHFSGCDDCP